MLPRITESAADWLRRRKAGQPFFLYVPFTSPHAPIVPGKDFVGRSKAGGYGDFMVQTDEAVGRILKALDETGLAKDTIVVFSSDNGPEHYAYERVRATGHRSMGPYRGLKRDLYEAGHRVPFLVRWPGVVPAGRVSDGLLSQIDVYATVASAAGVPVPAGSAEDSLDQTALWKGTGPSARRTLVHNTNPNGYALRHGDWVLIQARSGAISKVPDWFAEAEGHVPNPHPGELYDLRADPGQKSNLYGKHPEKVAELAAMLQDLKAKAGKAGNGR